MDSHFSWKPSLKKLDLQGYFYRLLEDLNLKNGYEKMPKALTKVMSYKKSYLEQG